jgi:Nucleotidyl transferase AbiEii toxin, Type IV TA system
MLTQLQVQRYTVDLPSRHHDRGEGSGADVPASASIRAPLLGQAGLQGWHVPAKNVSRKSGTVFYTTDLDFTGIEEHDHEDVMLAMMEAFGQPFHGIQFVIPDEGYYETPDGLSWGVNPTYTYEWDQRGSALRLQISRRETPTLPTELRAQIEQSYFRFLPFVPTELVCLALPEILAEKIRACYQRNKSRDIYDLGMFAMRPLNHALIRRLVVLKLWQARDTFDPARLMQKLADSRDFDWDDLRDLGAPYHE